MCKDCLSKPACIDIVSTSCIKDSKGILLENRLATIETNQTTIETAVAIDKLVARDLSVIDKTSLTTILQSLIDLTDKEPADSITVYNLLKEPILLLENCESEECGGATSRSINQVLLNLLKRVFDLENRVSALENDKFLSTPYTIPQY